MATIQKGDVRIYFEVSGNGPAVVLGHSFLCSGEMWGPQLLPLAEKNKVINIDLRGHGRSTAGKTAFDLYDLVDDVLAVLDHLGIDRAYWAGLSIGGMVALRAALVVPDRVSGLILLDTHAGSESVLVKLKYQAMVAMGRALGISLMAPEIVRMFFSSHTRKVRPDLVNEWRDKFLSVPFPAIRQTVAALRCRDSVVGRLGEIEVPALVLVGEKDKPLPPACSQEIADGLPNASYVEIRNAGHLSNLEQPSVVTSAMVSFLENQRE